MLDADTDSDNLNDGYEVELWYDPINPNPDGDSYNDSDELKNNTSPYVYTLNAKESVDAFAKGMVLGEFDEAENFETLAGQITGSFIPFYADGRDYFANIIVHQSTGDAIVNLFFCLVDCTPIGVAADVTKVSTKIGKFFIKFSDDAPKVLEAIIRATKLFPDDDLVPALAKAIPASSLDDVVDSIKNGDKITKADYTKLCNVLKAAGNNADKLTQHINSLIKRVEDIDGFRMTTHINVPKHAWDKVISGTITNDAIQSVIEQAIQKGNYRYINQCQSVIEISYDYLGEVIIVRGRIIDGVLTISDAWVKTV